MEKEFGVFLDATIKKALVLYSSFSTVEAVVYNLILVFFFFIVALVTFVFISRINKTITERKIAALKMDVDKLITAILFETEDPQFEILKFAIKFNQQLKNKSYRNIIIGQLVNIYKNISVDSDNGIYMLYLHLQLHNDSLAKLKSLTWDERAQGVRELADMGYRQAVLEIFRLVNDKNNYVRTEVQSALVQLTGFDGLKFLNALEYPLSNWQQLNLIHILRKAGKENMPDYTQWLNSMNPSVIIFTLKLIRLYNQSGYIQEVADLFGHPREEVVAEAIMVFGETNTDSSTQKLKDLYSANQSLKPFVLTALQGIVTSEDLAFLKNVICDEENFHLKKEAVRIAHNIGEDGIMMIEEMVKTDNHDINQIIKHVRDSRI